MNREQDIDFRTRNLVFIDLETTGLNPDRHEIIEVGCLLVDGKSFEILESFTERVKPTKLETADRESLKVSEFSEKEWEDAKDLTEVLREVNKFAAKGGMIVGWNVFFDWSFLDHAFRNSGIKSNFDYHRIDVMTIAYSKLHGVAEVRRLGLRHVAGFFGIALSDKHRAQEDTQATYEIFKKLMK